MNTLKFITTILLISLSMLSCGDDDTPEIVPPEDSRPDGREEVLLSNIQDAYGEWRFESITIDEEAVDINRDGSKNRNLFLELPSCYIDNTYILREEELFSFVDTFSTCEDNEQDAILQEGVVIFLSFGSEENQLRFSSDQIFANRGDWDNVKVLSDPKNPTKRYLEFSAFATDIGVDTFTINSRATVVLIADK